MEKSYSFGVKEFNFPQVSASARGKNTATIRLGKTSAAAAEHFAIDEVVGDQCDDAENGDWDKET